MPSALFPGGGGAVRWEATLLLCILLVSHAVVLLETKAKTFLIPAGP